MAFIIDYFFIPVEQLTEFSLTAFHGVHVLEEQIFLFPFCVWISDTHTLPSMNGCHRLEYHITATCTEQKNSLHSLVVAEPDTSV